MVSMRQFEIDIFASVGTSVREKKYVFVWPLPKMVQSPPHEGPHSHFSFCDSEPIRNSNWGIVRSLVSLFIFNWTSPVREL